MEVRKGKREETVEEVFSSIVARVKIEEVKGLEGSMEGESETIWVRLQNDEQKREVIRKKKELKGRKQRVVEDWTWKERKMRWKLEENARREVGKGKRV